MAFVAKTEGEIDLDSPWQKTAAPFSATPLRRATFALIASEKTWIIDGKCSFCHSVEHLSTGYLDLRFTSLAWALNENADNHLGIYSAKSCVSACLFPTASPLAHPSHLPGHFLCFRDSSINLLPQNPLSTLHESRSSTFTDLRQKITFPSTLACPSLKGHHPSYLSTVRRQEPQKWRGWWFFAKKRK